MLVKIVVVHNYVFIINQSINVNHVKEVLFLNMIVKNMLVKIVLEKEYIFIVQL